MLYLRKTLGVLMALFGALFLLLAVVGLIDPKGTKMADDNDPFGKPPSWVSNMLTASASGLAMATGYRLAKVKNGNVNEN
jgi:hypothetical protein